MTNKNKLKSVLFELNKLMNIKVSHIGESKMKSLEDFKFKNERFLMEIQYKQRRNFGLRWTLNCVLRNNNLIINNGSQKTNISLTLPFEKIVLKIMASSYSSFKEKVSNKKVVSCSIVNRNLKDYFVTEVEKNKHFTKGNTLSIITESFTIIVDWKDGFHKIVVNDLETLDKRDVEDLLLVLKPYMKMLIDGGYSL